MNKKPIEEEIGLQYGLLTVEDIIIGGMGKKRLKCYCKCGEEVITNQSSLHNHSIRCCGKQDCKYEARGFKNLVGEQFGQLQVIARAENTKNGTAQWLCKCSCGNEIIVPTASLKQGLTKSCGCLKRKINQERGIQEADIVSGQRFGQLTVLEFSQSHNKRNYWKCQCDCGNIKEFSTNDLTSHHVVSCGCMRSKGEKAIANFLNAYHILFKQEYTFDDLIDKGKLRFDFAIFNKENQLICLIEFDGSQHYIEEQSGYLAGQYNEIHRRDTLKNEYCLQNNIKLYRICYNENLDTRLEEILNDIRCKLN